MKAVVDQSQCIGCQLCNSILPEVFTISSDGFTAEGAEFEENLRSEVEEAVDSCPTEAISIEE